MNHVINKAAFTPNQQEMIGGALNNFMQVLCLSAPALGPHFLSGGVLEIKTVSGAHLKFGFDPRAGGLVLPGGIRPVNGVKP